MTRTSRNEAPLNMRVGQALGLRHEDVVTWENRIEIVSRENNGNGARGKGGAGSVPVGAELMRLYAQYMHVEYGSLDSDYVFVRVCLHCTRTFLGWSRGVVCAVVSA
jgi:hypothetical protein